MAASALAEDHHEAIVIGGGISGLVTLKTLRQKGIDCIVYESKEYHGGLWHFNPQNYGVMEFTHTNISKHNYAFSDFPFSDETVDYPHHSAIAEYIDSYVEHFKLYDHIKYRTNVVRVSRLEGEKKGWKLRCDSKAVGGEFSVTCDYLVVATGHHAKPKFPEFLGQESFGGTIIHSVDYNDVVSNGFEDKNVVVVGIGNSAVDVAVNCAARGGQSRVHLSTRSGAWVLPNYVLAQPIDLYGSRLYLNLPLFAKQFLLETAVRLLTGDPRVWKLNPKVGALQAAPTFSPTLIHQIQRGKVKVMPNIKKICESSVVFDDGSVARDVDVIINCTGYTIDLPYLPRDLREMVMTKDSSEMKLYKNVFSPDIGPDLAFIGFAQPFFGGIIPVAEIQAQWLAMVIKGHTHLPPQVDMSASVAKYELTNSTKQQDTLTYNDEIASLIGSRPGFTKHMSLVPRLWLGCGGVAQWSLQGPFYNPEAEKLVQKVPVPSATVYLFIFGMVVLLYAFYWLMSSLLF